MPADKDKSEAIAVNPQTISVGKCSTIPVRANSITTGRKKAAAKIAKNNDRAPKKARGL